MDLIFQQALEKAVESVILNSQTELGLSSSGVPLPRVRVDEPNDSSFGFISSGISFQLAKLLETDPERVAESLISRVSKEHFSLSVDGGGYINANPTEAAKREFFKLDLTTNFVLPQLMVDWGSKYINRAFAGLGGEEARFLRAHLNSEHGDKFPRPDALQLLACLGDPEISATPFLRRLGSSENIPWFLDRFFDIATELGSESSQFEISDPLLHELIHSVLHLRGRLSREFEERRPERALNTMLKVVRAIFSVYNRPEMRAALRERSLLGEGFRVITNRAFKVSQISLGALVFP